MSYPSISPTPCPSQELPWCGNYSRCRCFFLFQHSYLIPHPSAHSIIHPLSQSTTFHPLKHYIIHSPFLLLSPWNQTSYNSSLFFHATLSAPVVYLIFTSCIFNCWTTPTFKSFMDMTKLERLYYCTLLYSYGYTFFFYNFSTLSTSLPSVALCCTSPSILPCLCWTIEPRTLSIYPQ